MVGNTVEALRSADAGPLTRDTGAPMTPEEILNDPVLREQEKADLLCGMSYDAVEQAVAAEEGMSGDDDDLQRRVLLALNQLHRMMDVEHTSPTKQHGTCLISWRG